MDFTASQRRAITQDGHLAVLAGPGSGKTRVITEKIWYLLEKEVIPPPFGVLALTFTNGAAQEMRSRIRERGFQHWDKVWIGTFHGFGRYLLSCYGSDIGISENFDILSVDDQKAILEPLCSNYNESASNVGSRISALKRQGIYPGQRNIPEPFSSIYIEYQQALSQQNKLDFDDLVSLSVKLLDSSPLAYRVFTNFFRYVVVDEFQDSDAQQMELVLRFTLAATNLGSTIVADDDQSIYRFRGAIRTNVYEIQKRLQAQQITFEENFRSDQAIVEAANKVIANDMQRLARQTRSISRNSGRLIQCAFGTPSDEAQQIARWANEAKQTANVENWEDIAVLCRTKNRLAQIIDEFSEIDIPCFDRNRLDFQESWETSLCLAILSMSVDPSASGTLYQVMSALENCGLAAAMSDKDALEVALGIRDLVNSRRRDLANTISDWEDMLTDVGLWSLLNLITSSPSEVVRLKINISNMLKTLDREMKSDNLTLPQAVSRLTGLGAVQIMSGHLSKGREYDIVFFVGLEEGWLPYFRAQSEEELSEELRIFYVGMTRARHILYLTYAQQVANYSGRLWTKQRSRFLDYIPSQLVDRC